MFQMPANTSCLGTDGSVAQPSAEMTAVEITIKPGIESLHEGNSNKCLVYVFCDVLVVLDDNHSNNVNSFSHNKITN